MAGPSVLFKTGTHGSRPAASAGTVHYYCTTDSKLEQSDGSSWSDLYTFSGVVGSDYIAKAFLAAKGDLIGASANDTPSLLTVGTNGTILKADSAETTGLKWVQNLASLNFIIDGAGSAITTGIKGDVEVPFAWSDIASARLLADQSGSIVVDIWKDTYANFPPVDADSITASAPPTISSATKSQDTTLTGWTKTGSAGDILRFNVDSITTCTRVTLSLVLVKS